MDLQHSYQTLTTEILSLRKHCESVLLRMDEACKNHENHIPDDLNIEMLETIKIEVLNMKKALEIFDLESFTPGYSRFIIDCWPDEHGLCRKLIDLEYYYERLQRQYVIYKRKLAEQEEKDS